MDKPFIIVHGGGCKDGFTSAWIAYKYFTQNHQIEPDFHYAKFSEPIPDVSGRDVLMFDFSYSKEILLDMKTKAKSIKVFDHHKSAQEDLKTLDFCIFDMNKSGAQLAWDYFYPEITVRYDLVDYVADQDLWKFELENSKVINTAISSYEMTFDNWNYLNSIIEYWSPKEEWEKLLNTGQIIIQQKDKYIKEICEYSYDAVLPAEFGKFAGTPVKVANSPYMFASFAGHELAKASPSKIGVCWFKRSDGLFQYSFRGIGDVDVSAICKTIGGGGHRLASGAESKTLLL